LLLQYVQYRELEQGISNTGTTKAQVLSSYVHAHFHWKVPKRVFEHAYICSV